jgi:hypothetical protein
MDLTQDVLRGMLATIFAVDPMYVLPRQGNWFNPQDMLPTAEKPKTWVAFDIEFDKPLDIVHYQGNAGSGFGNDSVQHRTANIVLQLVGTRAHSLAYSVGHWIHNQTVRDQLALIEGQLFGDVGAITTTDFHQDGANTVKAYNVRFRVVWVSRIPTGQGLFEDVAFQGKVV